MWFGLGAITLILIGWSVASARRVLYPERRTLPILTPVPPYRSHTLTASDGDPLEIWVLEPAAPRGRLLLCHGYYANRYQMLSLAHGLREQGYETVLFEMRGHGTRPGPCTLGIKERADAEAILRWAQSRDGSHPLPLGAVGFSMGGAVICQLASRAPEVRALVVDSIYSRLFPVLTRAIREQYHLPAIPWAYLTWWTVQLLLGRRLAALDPVTLAPRLRRPLFAIQGGEERRVAPRLSDELFRQWAGPKEQWVGPQVAHVGMFAHAPDEYCRRVAAFFDRTLTSMSA